MQHHVATMELNNESSHSGSEGSPASGSRAVAAEADRPAIAPLPVGTWSLDTVDRALKTCGARGLIRPSPLERIHRDLTFYVRHDNADSVLATIGREILGRPHEARSSIRPRHSGAGRPKVPKRRYHLPGTYRLRIWGLAFGYFAFYIPYSGLTKALSQGRCPGRPAGHRIQDPAGHGRRHATVLLA